MTIWRGRQCRAAVALVQRAGATGLFAAALLAIPAGAATDEGGVADPRDVGTRLDLKTLTHAEAGSSIVYTAQTYGPFSDQSTAFKWGLDRDRDENFDLIVFAEWRDGALVGGVTDPAGRQVAPASVARPGPTAVRVSFPAEVLGDVSVYRYAVNAEAAPGERDLAPNSGLVHHQLGAPPAKGGVRTASAAAPAPAPMPQAASAAPAPTPVAAPAPPAASGLPRTGPGDRMLLPWSGVGLMIGGAFVALGAQRRGACRGARVSGGHPRRGSTGEIR